MGREGSRGRDEEMKVAGYVYAAGRPLESKSARLVTLSSGDLSYCGLCSLVWEHM